MSNYYCKKIILYSLTVFILVLSLTSKTAYCQLEKFHPDLAWEEITTEHFYIYYHQGLEDIAFRAAAIAEQVHERLAPVMDYRESFRTRVIIADTYDEANGLATVIYDKHILLLATPPDPTSSLANYDDWLEMVITHEYSHVLHLDMSYKLPRVLRTIMGRPPIVMPGFYPSYFLPLWILEGMSVTNETLYTEGGRGHGSNFDMMLRTALVEDQIPDISRGNSPQRKWPAGNYSYLFGYSFFEYLRNTYNQDAPVEFAKAYSGRLVPYFLNRTLKKKFGKTFIDLWPHWEDYLAAKYYSQITRIKSEEITSTKIG